MIDTYDILDSNLSKSEVNLVKAATGKRFTNYIIDRIVFTLALYGIIISLTMVPFFYSFITEINTVVDYIFSSVIFALLYFSIETLTGGKTIGKYITQTRVLTVKGKKPNFNHYLARSFSRIVPFEPFSFINDVSNGWHDKWSETIVIDERKSNW